MPDNECPKCHAVMHYVGEKVDWKAMYVVAVWKCGWCGYEIAEPMEPIEEETE